MQAVRTIQVETVPNHLKDSHYKGAAKLGHGADYQYAHNFPNHYVDQQYLPDELVGSRFYQPSDQGYEKTIAAHMQYIRGEV